ncbi:taurine ABC transporter substrate-binding protein [Sulfidibacter corallicola]|uniref:Taurine ABC transporter substrate-binding protein n=1 Tax=Sulfidibacter corallicola TaxID=2818388 RepID=A0A8A4TJY1_SULCO|nr:taurine ABC transporter substrate-binding protein [Sulfidibacter corallicola]QTD49504.1 taurine ABC transporter substrate-binding protein [Sulfidibacter corallicola]
MKIVSLSSLLLALSFAILLPSCTQSEKPSSAPSVEKQEPVTIGYQGMLNPWKVGIQSGAFEKATGRTIQWRKFNSGSEVIAAMASGDVQIAVAGSSPIATAMSRGVDVSLFWILEAIRDNEALVAREGSGIETIEDLKGKTVGVPFASTTHYHMLVALEHYGIDAKEVKLLNLQPDAVMAAWSQGQIDASFVWSPILNEITKTGKVLLTSGELADLGKPTFDGMIVLNSFAANQADFMNSFVGVIAKMDEDYRQNKASWTPETAQIKAIAELTGAKPEDVPTVLAQYHFPSPEEQCSAAWLDGGAAKALYDTALFLRNQKKINQVHDAYGPFVTKRFAETLIGDPAAEPR